MSKALSSPHKLRELRVSGFKALSGEAQIPLDGDIVLIYGPNGSGKTSVLSAIEWALTGSVGDLAAFKKDYPGCLRNASYLGRTSASLTYTDSAGIERVASQDMHEGVGAPVASMDSSQSRWFVERCYLSQTRLGRLLEAHQSKSSSTQSEFVRFLTALLGMDWVDNLVTGLEKSARTDSLKANFGVLRDLDKRITQAESHAGASSDKVDRLATGAKTETVEIASLLAASGLLTDSDRITGRPPKEAADYIARVLTPMVKKAQSDTRGQAKEWQERVGLARALSSESKSYTSVGAGIDAITTPLLEVLDRLAANSREVARVWDVVKNDLPEVHSRTVQIEEREIVEFPSYAGCVEGLSMVERTTRDAARNAESLKASSKLLSLNIDQLETAIAASDAPGAESLSRMEEQSRLLAQIAKLITGPVCPVCERDFSEVSDQPLAESVARRLGSMGSQVEGWRIEIERRVARMANLEKTRQELAVVSRSMSDMESSDVLESKHNRASEVLVKFVDFEAGWVQYERDVSRARSLSAQLKDVSAASERMQDLVTRVSVLSDQYGIVLSQMEPAARADELLTRAQTAGVTADRNAEHINNLAMALGRLARAREEIAPAEQELTETSDLLEQLKERRATTQTISEEAKLVFQKAGKARADAVEKLFSQEFNRIWADMFSRLAADETFVPSGTLRLLRSNLQLDLLAKRPATDDCFSLASILSAGNLNTAALTLFLTLHLMEEPLMPLVILDDPVQSMDDVHLLNFASLLRGLSRDADRQVVVAVHEKALFDYLKAELHPSAAGRTMVVVEITPGEGSASTRVRSSRHVWEGDTLRFAANA